MLTQNNKSKITTLLNNPMLSEAEKIESIYEWWSKQIHEPPLEDETIIKFFIKTLSFIPLAHESKTIEQFITLNQGRYYGFTGLGDMKPNGEYSDGGRLYELHKEDFTYNKPEKEIYLNVGRHSNEKLKYLLEVLFVPFDDTDFDLLSEMRKQDLHLVLYNNNKNQSNSFYAIIDEFFADKDIVIKKQGTWK